MDPAAGPLQSFAYDLRKVRSDAGNPTYRALARAAGYSATTLSEAASGMRRPSLDVVLAYVGACGGDVEAWRRRWHEMDAELGSGASAPETPEARSTVTPTAAAAVPATGMQVSVTPVAGSPGGPHPPLSGPGTGRPRRWWTRPPAIAAAAALVVFAATVAVFFGPIRPRAAEAPTCPKGPVRPAFTGTTYASGAHVRSGPARDEPVLFTIPSNCTVGFVGYCLGQKVHDSTGGTPDVRWFKLPDGKVVSSAVVHGNPPVTLRPSRCDRDRPLPETVELSVAVDGGLKLAATGSNVDIVGFAVSAVGPGPRKWRQVAFTEAVGSRFSAVWKVEDATLREVAVAAVACLGGDGPTDVIDAETVQIHNPGVPAKPLTLAPEEARVASRLACQYPGRG